MLGMLACCTGPGDAPGGEILVAMQSAADDSAQGGTLLSPHPSDRGDKVPDEEIDQQLDICALAEIVVPTKSAKTVSPAGKLVLDNQALDGPSTASSSRAHAPMSSTTSSASGAETPVKGTYHSQMTLASQADARGVYDSQATYASQATKGQRGSLASFTGTLSSQTTGVSSPSSATNRTSSKRQKRGSVEMVRHTVTKGFRAFASRVSTVAHQLMGIKEASEVPQVAVPQNKAPCAEQNLQGMTITEVRRAVQGDRGGCMAKFLAETMNCGSFETDKWSVHPSGVYVGHMSYDMPAPKDIPDSAKRIVTIPDQFPCSTDMWMALDSDQALVMLMRTSTSGVTYSDRMHLEYIYEFRIDGQGGLTTKLWAQTVWSKPLPWTHSWIAKALDKRIIADSCAKFGAFLRQLQAGASQGRAEQAERAEREPASG